MNAAPAIAAVVTAARLSHTPDRPTCLTWTGSKTFRSCPLRFRRRYVQRLPELATVPLERGSGVHEVLEQVGRAAWGARPLTDEQLRELIADRTASIHPEAADDARRILDRYMAAGGPPDLPSDAQDVQFERPFALDAKGQPCAWDSPAAMYRSILDRVYTENAGALVVVDDYKTNWVIEDPGEQMRQYAWAAFALYPAAEEVCVRLHFVRFGRCIRTDVLTREDVEGTGAALVALHLDVDDAISTDTFPARISLDCLTCSYQATCPEVQRDVVPRALVTAEDAREAADDLVRLQVRATAREAQLKAYVAERGPVDCGGEVYGPVARDKRSAVAPVAGAVLAEHGVTDDELWDAVTLGSGALKKLVTKAIASVPRRERGAARARVEAEIEKAGGFEHRTDVEVRRTKKGAGETAPEDAPAGSYSESDSL